MMPSADEEVENLKATVSRHFRVDGVVVTPLALTFQVTALAGEVDGAFDALRQELMPRGYIPAITRERGELLVHIQRRPPMRFASLQVNLVLLLLTLLTTILFGGAWNWSEYAGKPLLSAESILNGAVFFSAPLLAILGFHEMGHYLVAKRHKVRASLPFFLPSLPPLGTFGAFISMRDPLPSRKALLDIGASGPLVGFAIAIPVTIAGLFLTAADPRPLPPLNGTLQFIQPSMFYAFLGLFFPVPQNTALHPLAFAGWVGLFVTAINLLPAGQLDGGHIARALLGPRQHYVSWAAILLLFVMGSWYAGWFIFGFLILMLGVRHPPPLNDLSRLDAGRKLIGIAAAAILLLTFVPQPFVLVEAPRGAAFETVDGEPLSRLAQEVALGSSTTLTFALNHTSAVTERVNLSILPMNLDSAGFTLLVTEVLVGNDTLAVNAPYAELALGPHARAIVRLEVTAPTSLPVVPSDWDFKVQAVILGTDLTSELAITLTVT